MKTEASLQPQLRQQLKLAPQIIQSIEILQLPLLALYEHIQQELEENPVLEESVNTKSPSQEEELAPEIKENRHKDDGFERFDEMAEEWQDYSRATYWKTRGEEERDRKQSALENTPSQPISFQEHLLGQLSLVDVPADLREFCEYLTCHIDDDGYLRDEKGQPYNLEDIIKSFGSTANPPQAGQPTANKGITLEQAQEALKIVQSLEPPGVGARDLKECLRLQLDERLENYKLAREIISNHLHDIELRRYPQIAKKTGQNLEVVKQVVDFICTLNPKPGSLFTSQPSPYIMPDVRVEYVDGRYEVILNEDGALPPLYISPQYRRFIKEADPKTRQFIHKKMESARWLIEAIEQRRSTLYKVATKLVERQKRFFEEGISGLRPLKMQELADEIGICVSTVSRAVAHKYMQTPRGVFDMKFFFTGGFKSTDGTVKSWEAMRQKLAEIIAREDKSSPLSDDDIAAMLKSGGVDIARRTVTKYRKSMKIPSSRRRRQY